MMRTQSIEYYNYNDTNNLMSSEYFAALENYKKSREEFEAFRASISLVGELYSISQLTIGSSMQVIQSYSRLLDSLVRLGRLIPLQNEPLTLSQSAAQNAWISVIDLIQSFLHGSSFQKPMRLIRDDELIRKLDILTEALQTTESCLSPTSLIPSAKFPIIAEKIRNEFEGSKIYREENRAWRGLAGSLLILGYFSAVTVLSFVCPVAALLSGIYGACFLFIPGIFIIDDATRPLNPVEVFSKKTAEGLLRLGTFAPEKHPEFQVESKEENQNQNSSPSPQPF